MVFNIVTKVLMMIILYLSTIIVPVPTSFVKGLELLASITFNSFYIQRILFSESVLFDDFRFTH